MENDIDIQESFDEIWRKIEKCENFALMRFGDGERAIMTGQPVCAIEGWESPNEMTDLGYALLESITLHQTNVYYGISCPCCDQEAYYWYKSRIGNCNITFSNLFVNCCYKKFKTNFDKLEREAIYIGNYRGENKKFGNLNIIDYFTIDDDCINFWVKDAPKLISNIKKKYGKKNNILYLISAGPLSEPIIADLFKNNPNNCYIDFGSSLDEYIHEQKTRTYMSNNSKEANKICKMPDNNTLFDVSIVLTLYKRPEVLKQQIEAIKNQSLKPKEIILFHDKSDSEIILDNDTLIQLDNYIKTNKNIGVWGRFMAALSAKSTYICILDDDTIPGRRWLENCHCEIQKKEGLYVTRGILSTDLSKYPFYAADSWGWCRPNDNAIQVDFGGHAWFLKKDWLGAMFINYHKIQKLKYVGEDMYLSFSLRKIMDIKTYIPPHPIDNIEFFGSYPNEAKKYGENQNVAVSSNDKNLKLMNKAINIILQENISEVIYEGSYEKPRQKRHFIKKQTMLIKYFIKKQTIPIKYKFYKFLYSYVSDKKKKKIKRKLQKYRLFLIMDRKR